MVDTRGRMQERDERLLVPLKEAAHLLSMGYNRALYQVRSGHLRSVRNGARILISRREIEAFIERAEGGQQGREAS